jgi:AraC-like DNA-binding protein
MSNDRNGQFGPGTVVSQRIDSPFGWWVQTEWRPAAHLADIVERIWHFDGSVAHAHERIFPNGVVELIVHLDHRYKLFANGSAEPCAEACIGGLYTGAFVIEAPSCPCRVLGIRFRPAAAFTVLGMPMSELTNITADLCDVVGPAARELADRCCLAENAEACVRLAARWVESQLAIGRETDPAVEWIASQLEQAHGVLPVTALREEAGLSATRLAAAFRTHVGVTAKQYGRIMRFRQLLAMLHRGNASLADGALAAGYYDQPHMNAEFRELSGFTPREFLAANRYSESSLAEAAR